MPQPSLPAVLLDVIDAYESLFRTQIVTMYIRVWYVCIFCVLARHLLLLYSRNCYYCPQTPVTDFVILIKEQLYIGAILAFLTN